MLDKEQVPDGWIGSQVDVRLTSSEAQGAEILATLQDKDDDGITLSELGELGPEPALPR